jgi:hypothetical protein
LRFFDGQRLFADDLQGVEAFNREMRWLHNRSLHQPGIGSGFAVAGPVDAREVTVGPGYALDAEGREIVLTAAVVLPVPPVAHGLDTEVAYFDLAVSYPPDETLEDMTAETRVGVCVPAGAVRLREQPALCWVPLRGLEDNLVPETTELADDLKLFRRIVLVRVGVANCKIRSLDLAPRRATRPSCRPYIACGIAPATGLFAKPRQDLYVELQVGVVATGANFRSTPSYLARVERNPDAPKDENDDDEYRFPHPVFVHTQVIRSSVLGFVASIVVPLTTDTSKVELDRAAKVAAKQWNIVWMGVEE